MSDSEWPRRRQPIRLHRPWDCPGKTTGVGCHFLLRGIQIFKVCFIFSFVACTFGVKSKNSLQILCQINLRRFIFMYFFFANSLPNKSKKIYLYFSKCSMVLALIFMSYIHFELFLRMIWDPILFFNMCIASCPSTTHWRDCPPLNGPGTLVEISWLRCMGLFWSFKFVSFVSVPILIPVPYFCLLLIVLIFKIEKCQSSNFVLSQDCFGYSGLLVIPYEF